MPAAHDDWICIQLRLVFAGWGVRDALSVFARLNLAGLSQAILVQTDEEARMRLGFFLPHIGSWAGPEALADVARLAEELGFDSVWVTERSLLPLKPQTPYPLGDLPAVYRHVLDPLGSLAFIAAQTSRVRLGTSVLNLPWYSPVLVARQLTTLDVLSSGRLQIGFGQGWSKDEYEAAGIPWEHRGRRFEEAVHVLKTIWTTDPVEFDGDFYTIPRSYIGPKPVQKPHPPIYMAAYTQATMARVARLADGWHPTGIPLANVAEMFDAIKSMAQGAGRDPAALELIVRGNIALSKQPPSGDRLDFTGTSSQIAADVGRAHEIGVSELILDATFDPGVRSQDDVIERLELVAQIGNRSSARA
jgi:probable F420-dependent oxidoreductase